MIKKFLTTYFFILITLIIVMSLSRKTSDKMRGQTVAVTAPFWEKLLSFKCFLKHPTQSSPFSTLSTEEEQQYLKTENQLLSTEIAYLQQIINNQTLLSPNSTQLASIPPKKSLKATPARVIFRSFDTWNSSLWINVGNSLNRLNQLPVIAKNSPVVIGNAVIGVIDYVGEHQSRVRLISDSRLTPAVRAVRGKEQDVVIHNYTTALLQQLNRNKQLQLSLTDFTQLTTLLEQLKQQTHVSKQNWYLAKGELSGSPLSTRRKQDIFLKGTGFNYDFADAYGEGRELRLGKPLNNLQEDPLPLLKVNDILVTTGMDGIFPPDFQVAVVTHVHLLKEGDYFYEIEAKPIMMSLEELHLVFVLPPVSIDPPESY